MRQEQEAKEGFRAMDEHERALADRVRAALGSRLPGIEIEIDRETVTLRGKVANAGQLAYAEELVGEVDGVSGVVNQLVIAA